MKTNTAKALGVVAYVGVLGATVFFVALLPFGLLFVKHPFVRAHARQACVVLWFGLTCGLAAWALFLYLNEIWLDTAWEEALVWFGMLAAVAPGPALAIAIAGMVMAIQGRYKPLWLPMLEKTHLNLAELEASWSPPNS